MILESIVTTVSGSGQVNIAPMGPVVDESADADWDRFILRPFTTSTTYTNLRSTNQAVIHVTDDAGLFARAAIETIKHDEAVSKLLTRLDDSGWRLTDCHRWFQVTIHSISDEGPRVDIECSVIRSGTVRPFFGFNRAKHAVIEAAILATRVHLIPSQSIREQLERLRPPVQKTGGMAERDAFEMLEKTIYERMAEND